MLPVPNKYLVIAGATLLLVVGAYFKGHYDGKRKFDILKAELTIQAKADQKRVDEIERDNEYVKKEIADDYKKLADTRGGTIADLSKRLRDRPTINLSTPGGTTCKPGDPAVGPGASGSESPPAAAPGPTASLDAFVLRDALTIGRDALDAELLWRKWARETR